MPAAYIRVDGMGAGPLAVISPAAAEKLDATVAPVGLLVSGTEITKDAQRDAKEALQGVAEGTSFYVERGYQADGETVVIQLVLGALGAVLMLGGTLTATFLALSDARPDLATLSAVGASPRMRRGGCGVVRTRGRLRRSGARGRGRVHPGHRDHLSADERLGLRADVGDGVATSSTSRGC